VVILARRRVRGIKNANRYPTLLVNEKGYRKQRAKILWLQKGDLKISFFHMSALARGKKKGKCYLLRQNSSRRYHDNMYFSLDFEFDIV
jgi:hypothetical protein